MPIIHIRRMIRGGKMLRGLYTAVSAMQVTEKKIDVTANNIANVNTTSFKKDVVISETFPEVLLQKINGKLPSEAFSMAPIDVQKDGEAYQLSSDRGLFTVKSPLGLSYNREIGFALDESGYLKTYSRNGLGDIDTSQGNLVLDSNGKAILIEGNSFEVTTAGQVVSNGQVVANLINRGTINTIGTINGGLRISKVDTDFSQGSLEETGNDLDLAIQGKGFFKVLTPKGEMYTRNGNFTINTNGEIVTAEGYYLSGEYGSILAEGRDFTLSESGALILNDQVVDRIEIVDIANLSVLRKYGEGYFQVTEGGTLETQPFNGKVLQGFLESSNVNSIKEMVEMISNFRSYESNQKIVKAYDDILQRAVNDIGILK